MIILLASEGAPQDDEGQKWDVAAVFATYDPDEIKKKAVEMIGLWGTPVTFRVVELLEQVVFYEGIKDGKKKK